jgi:hypothetical protein
MTLILNGTNGLSDVDGSASTPAIRGTDTNTGIFFPAADTIAFAEGGAEVARFDSSGNLGIGTNNPATKIHVAGTPAATSGGLLQLRDNSATGSNTTLGSVFFSSSPGTDYYVGKKSESSVGSLAFGNANSGAEYMRIDSSGNLLINTTSAISTSSFLNIKGVANTRSCATFAVGANGNGALDFFNASNAYIAAIVVNASTVSYNTGSDYRLKDNIAPMTGALEKVAQLKPSTWSWKNTGEQAEGFIAHELAEVCPDAVSGEKDAVDAEGKPKYQGVDTSFLVATLTAAIQEQQAIITDLKSRIEALEQA